MVLTVLTRHLMWLQVAALHGLAAGSKTKQVCCTVALSYAEPPRELWLEYSGIMCTRLLFCDLRSCWRG